MRQLRVKIWVGAGIVALLSACGGRPSVPSDAAFLSRVRFTRAEYTAAATYALARAQEVAAAALFDDNTTQTVGVLGSEYTDDNLLQAWTYLKNSAAQGPFGDL